MRKKKPFNLFVYGTLMNPSVFRAVLGRRIVMRPEDADGNEGFLARYAVLDGYKKISPDNTYLYAVPDPHGRIRGYMISDLPAECLSALRRYEGRNYSRRTLRVQTRDGVYRAVVFVGNLRQLEHSFGYAFHDPFKQEVLLREKIERALVEAQREQLHIEQDDSIIRRAVGELHGRAIRDVIREHFDSGGISDYAIRHSIQDEPLRDFARIRQEPEAVALAPHYLAMVVRQVIFNQLEEAIRRDFRYELDHMGSDPAYYSRTMSSLAALNMLNDSGNVLDMLIADCLSDLHFESDRLIDFIRWAVAAADGIYDTKLARRWLAYINSHIGRGHVPLGAEMEFSNIGHGVILDPEGRRLRDAAYDGFFYFNDFGLDILTWKLGGHVDDHRDKASSRPHRGFFEVAMGNLSIGENISKPITCDPWLLNQMIHAVRRFYPVAPHSLHVSLQLRHTHKPVQDRMLPMEVMKCLFAIAGDPVLDEAGRPVISRLVNRDIVNKEPTPSMLFSEVRKRYSRRDEVQYAGRPHAGGRYVQQFRFIRLSPNLNYEPIIMALKGVQIALLPSTFLTGVQYESSRKHRRAFDELMAWGASPTPLPTDVIDAFLGHVQKGLMNEHRRQPAHSQAYIAWSISQLRQVLEGYNALVGQSPKPAKAMQP